MAKARHLSPGRIWGEILVILTDDEGIRTVNRHVFERDRATDVISLTYAPMPPETDLWTGELVINVQRAREESVRLGPRWTFIQELALYLAHGCDHLADQDDADEPGRRRMRRRELIWVRDAAKEGLLAPLQG